MKMEINEKKENPILGRTEIHFTVNHVGEVTPTKGAVSEELAKQLKVKKEVVMLNSIDSVYGSGISKGYAKVYTSKEAAIEFESAHILKRNGIEKKPVYVAEAKPEE